MPYRFIKRKEAREWLDRFDKSTSDELLALLRKQFGEVSLKDLRFCHTEDAFYAGKGLIFFVSSLKTNEWEEKLTMLYHIFQVSLTDENSKNGEYVLHQAFRTEDFELARFICHHESTARNMTCRRGRYPLDELLANRLFGMKTTSLADVIEFSNDYQLYVSLNLAEHSDVHFTQSKESNNKCFIGMKLNNGDMCVL